jgi:hypothetical protein
MRKVGKFAAKIKQGMVESPNAVVDLPQPLPAMVKRCRLVVQ